MMIDFARINNKKMLFLIVSLIVSLMVSLVATWHIEH